MKSALVSAAWIGFTAATLAAPSFAQLQDNTEKRLTCDNGSYDGDRARHCEIREQTVPAVGRLGVDASPNGGVTVKGWLQGNVLVRARVEAYGETQASAAAIAGQVAIAASGGDVRSSGPQRGDNSSWSVSYEIFVPQTTDLTVKTVNGGIRISDVRGQIRFDTTNGGIQLARLAGDVSGATVNGGIHADLAGTMWDGRQLELKTHNGGVTLTVPASYSAHLQAETGVGRIQSDFPVEMTGNLRPRNLDMNLGAGGPLIHVSTGNGGVHIRRAAN